MKYAMMSYSLARQGMEPPEIVRTAAKLGFEGIDWVSTYGHAPEELARRCAEAGLPVVAYTFFVWGFIRERKHWREELERELDCAAALGAPLTMLPTPALEWAKSREEAQKRWLEVIRDFASGSVARGIVPTLENYPGKLSPLVTAADFEFFRREVPEIRLTFDNGNAAGGEDAEASCRATLPWIRHVHFKDWVVTDGPDGYEMLNGKWYIPALIGEGDMKFEGVMRILTRSGYDGFVNLEYESDRYAPEEAMRRALRYLREMDEKIANCR